MVQTFVTQNEVVNTNKSVQSNCNSIIFYNQGYSSVNIDQLILTPGASWTIDGNNNEINKTIYNIIFQDLTSNPNLIITRKIIEQPNR